MIVIVDYGLGNIAAFANLYRRLNIEVSVAKQASDLDGASKIIVPGVGHFDHAMGLLDGSGMRDRLDGLVMQKRVPVLGVCVGMQMLTRGSEEGRASGLGWVDGQVRSFKSHHTTVNVPLPHMGWNDVRPMRAGGLFEGLDRDARFYFLHSYYVDCDSEDDVLASCGYGVDFACALNIRNIFGVQFHPEKSHSAGTRLLKNFAEL